MKFINVQNVSYGANGVNPLTSDHQFSVVGEIHLKKIIFRFSPKLQFGEFVQIHND